MELRTDEARRNLNAQFSFSPFRHESYYQIGQIELNAHQDAKAESLFLKALERDPTHGGALTGLGVLAFRAKDYARLRNTWLLQKKTAPNYGPAHYYRGLALAHMRRKDEGEAELREATRLGSANPAVQVSPSSFNREN